MTTLQETIVVPRPIKQCFRYLLDFSTIEQWDPGVHRAQKVTPGEPRIGTRFDLILNSAGRKVPMQYELLQITAPNTLVLRGEGAGFNALDTLTLTAESATSTRIDYRAELTFSGAVAKVEPLLKPWLNRVGRKATDGLRAALADDPLHTPSLSARIGHKLLLPGAWQFTRKGYESMPHKALSQFMDGKDVVITGATAGLGMAAAQLLARLGARIHVVGRGTERLTTARQSIADFAGVDHDNVQVYDADLLDHDQLIAVAEQLNRSLPRIDVLINNAGALFADRDVTADGLERAMAINLVAPYRLTNRLLPALKAAKGRVINVASGGMYLQPLRLDDMGFVKTPYDGSKAYARAKRGLISLTEHWATEHPDIQWHSMHPGWADTPGVASSLPAFREKVGSLLRDNRMGADTMVWLASTHALSAADNGLFWFDRKARPTALLPGTAVNGHQQQSLLAWLARYD